jgi:hypothetical protein
MLETTETSPLAVPRYRSVEARRAKPGEGERRIIEAPNCIAPEAPDPKMWYDGATALSRGRSTRPATPLRRGAAGQEMAPQRLEKIESAPGNGSVSEVSNPQYLVQEHTADRARLRLTNREKDKVAEKGALGFEIARCRTEIGARGASLVRRDRLPGLERPTADRRLSPAPARRERPRDGEENFPGCKALKSHKTGKESRLADSMSRRAPVRRGETPAPQAKLATPTRRASIESTKRRKR